MDMADVKLITAISPGVFQGGGNIPGAGVTPVGEAVLAGRTRQRAL